MTFEDVKRIRQNPTFEDCDNKELSRLIDVAIEKQTPKKPLLLCKQYVGVARAGICKNCSMTENSSANYCRYCGQALDWGDSE